MRLSEKLLEENGINLGEHTQPMPYLDSSQTPATAHLFQHTASSHANTLPISAQAFEATLAEETRQMTATASNPSLPGHPDHGLYQQVRAGVERLDAQHHRSFDATSERISASLTALARKHGLQQVDHVLLSVATPSGQPAGHNIFVVQGRLDDPAHRRVHMATAEAAQMPLEQAFRSLDETQRRGTPDPVLQQVHEPLPQTAVLQR